ncbi:MAG: helix-turn-helix domain-containing protein [Pyrinomonadaceae bacterium]
MNQEFIQRLHTAFDHASMAEVARRLKIPHATVRNYYRGRLPAPEVLIKIAEETGISLNWLLMGKGEIYASDTPPIGLGKFIEDKIGDIVEQKLAARWRSDVQELGSVDDASFDLESAIMRSDDPAFIMNEWLTHEGRDHPSDYGVIFFQGWESFSTDEKVAALRDAKRVLDRSLKK